MRRRILWSAASLALASHKFDGHNGCTVPRLDLQVHLADMFARVLAGRKPLGAQGAPKRLDSRVGALVNPKITQFSIHIAALAALIGPPTRVR